MPIIKRGKRTRFASIPNEIINHDQLSNDAKIVLIYLLSKPPDWEIQFNDVQKKCKVGRDKRQAIFAKLEELGYFTREECRELGKFDYDYTVHEEPMTGNQLAAPLTESPSTVDTSTVYIKNTNTEKKTKKEIINEQAREVFLYWQEKFGYQKRTFEPRKKFLAARLNEGFSVVDLKRAVDGCLNWPYYLGVNDQNTKYDDIDNIFRNRLRVEKMIEKADEASSISTSTIGAEERRPSLRDLRETKAVDTSV